MSIAPSNNSKVHLLSNVPLSPQHQRTFTSESSQESYFLSKSSYDTTDATYVRKEGYISFPKGYDDVYACNYVMFQNTSFSGKWFYAYITKKEYSNPNTCKIWFEIDPYQTWQFDMIWKQSYVEREHCQRWNSDGSPVVNTVDEELNYGTEYDTVSIEQFVPYDNLYFLVIVSKEPLHTGTNPEITPVMNAVPTPLNYYVHPFKKDGSAPTTSQDGMNVAVSPVKDVLKGLYTIDNAVNNIVSIYVTEYVGIDIAYDGTTLTLPTTNFDHRTIQNAELSINTFYIKDKIGYNQMFKGFGNKYDGYASVSESKLMMYPYTTLILDDFKGNRVELKNEYIDSENLILTVRGSMGTSNKTSYTVEQYNSPSISGSDLLQLSQEQALINNDPNDIPILNDMLAAYLQGNRNSLNNQRNQLLFNSVSNTLGSVLSGVGSAVSRNPVGVASSIGNMGSTMADSYFQLQGMMAKKQDIDNTPPSISKMGSNIAYDFGNGYTGVYIIKKQIKAEYRKKLTDFFKMFGYKVNELKVPNLKTRQHFNFVKTVGANITGNIPQEDLLKIKTMFDDGITLWHGDWVQDYSLSNGEL